MKRRLLLVFLLLLAWSSLGMGTAGAGFSAAMDFHVADQFIESGTGIDQTGAVAEADNGDAVSVVGSGKFNRGSKKASGGGTFQHRDPGGAIIGSGSWTAKTLDGFVPYGCGDGTTLPKNFCGGLATLGVEVLPHSGTPLSGVLVINCVIGPGASGEEGITLDVTGVIDFDETIFSEGGLTVFVSNSKS